MVETGAIETEQTTVVKGTEISINFGDHIKATCKYDYSGPTGYFTFALEIGTWIWPTFNTRGRWETKNISIAAGTGKQQIISFGPIIKQEGLAEGSRYDMNWEIGRGSQGDGTWEFICRLITDDVIRIVELAPVFSNLSATYAKA